MTNCPQCFVPIEPAPAYYRCTGSCEEVVDTQYTMWFGRERRSRPLTVVVPPTDPKQARRWAPPEVGTCRQCRSEAKLVCPTCHYELPKNWLQSEALLIALAGPRTSGKSVYLGVMVQELGKLARDCNSNMSYVGRTRETYEKVYKSALYEARAMMMPTAAAHTDTHQSEPMILSLGRLNGSKVERFVVIRDVAGEDLENNHDRPYMRFYQNASLVLFHFDPTQIADVRNELRGMTTELNDVGGEPSTVLEHTLKILGSHRPKLAVALSKFDALQMIGANAANAGSSAPSSHSGNWVMRLGNPGAAFNREPADPLSYDEEDGQFLHEEVRSLLISLKAKGIVNQLENPAGHPIPHRFFATSALGEPPMNKQTNPRGIAPFRVLGPVKWALAEAGFIPKGAKK